MPVQADKIIKFFFLSKSITLKERKRLKYFLVSLLKKEGRKPSYINFIFCSDNYLLEINRQYLKHDYYTDIITFDLSANPKSLEAEIYISVDRIRENAKTLETTLREETIRVMFHGLLHLSGYGDKSAKEKERMRKMEDFYIAKFAR